MTSIVLFLAPLACKLPTGSPARETGDSRPPADSSHPNSDDSSTDDSSAHGDDSAPPDDSSTTSGDIEWTLMDSTNGPMSYQWAICDPHDGCEYPDPETCGGVSLGIVASQHELATRYAELLPGVAYVPKVDFSSHMVMWAYLCCCSSHGPYIVVDDVTRVGTRLEMSMHVDSWKLAPAAFGRPWVVVQVPIGHYDDVAYTLSE